MKKIIIIFIFVAVLVSLTIVLGVFPGNAFGQSGNLQSVTTGQATAPLSPQSSQSGRMFDTQQINREFISILANLQSIRLDDDIFSDPAFQALADNTIRLNQPGNEGRSNPFAPIGIEPSASTAPLSSVVNQNTSDTITVDTSSDSDTFNNTAEQEIVGSILNTLNQDQGGPQIPEASSNNTSEQGSGVEIETSQD